MIVESLAIYGERVDQALVGINKLRKPGQIDRTVVIVDESVTDVQKLKLRILGCEVYFHPFEDNLMLLHNQCLDKCQEGDWAIIHDPDEFFNDQFCRDVREICRRAGEKGIDLLLVNVHDILFDEKGTKTEKLSWFYKNLIFRKREGVRYTSDSEMKKIHESLQLPAGALVMKLDKEKYWYDHEKQWHEVWERAARNVFICGGGRDLGTQNPFWRPLREICNELGLDTWTKARAYFRKGNIHPHLKTWLWFTRYDGYLYQREMMEFGRWYFEYLHPEEAEGWKPMGLVKGSVIEVTWYVEETYENILGRGADEKGKETYVKAILNGQIRREDLPNILRESEEYQQRFLRKPLP